MTVRRDRDHYNDDHRVMTFRQSCELNGISLATGRRLLNAGTGPVFLQLSKRRMASPSPPIERGSNR